MDLDFQICPGDRDLQKQGLHTFFWSLSITLLGNIFLVSNKIRAKIGEEQKEQTICTGKGVNISGRKMRKKQVIT